MIGIRTAVISGIAPKINAVKPEESRCSDQKVSAEGTAIIVRLSRREARNPLPVGHEIFLNTMNGSRITAASRNRNAALCIGGTAITRTRIAIQVLPQTIDITTMARMMRDFMLVAVLQWLLPMLVKNPTSQHQDVGHSDYVFF